MDTHWVPFNLAWDDNVPIDISFVFEKEKPAGKHGFLTVQGDRMVFEDGHEGRFWGTCFNSGANFPSYAQSEMLARRLAKFGLNMMRTHQMDAEWAMPNIFQFNRAKPKDNTRSFDPESIDRLDYLIYCLKQAGVYLFLDLLTYRQFRPGDGVDAVDQLSQAAKPYDYFDPRLIELQKEFNRDLWTHTNPYTKLAYKDDPVIALTEIVNESDPFNFKPVLEPYRTRLEGLYRAWAEPHAVKLAAGPVDFTNPDPDMARFLVDMMQDHYRDMIAHLRSIGVKIPINGTNYAVKLGIGAAQAAADFSDTHPYWNFPTWESPQGTHAVPMVASVDNTFSSNTIMRLVDRPFFVSEWDHSWPDPYRAESPLAYAAVAAFQGWSGATIHTYRYSTWQPEERLGGGGSTINSITYRNHFDAFNDPAKFGLFYQAALLFRRGDVRPAKHSLAVEIPAERPEWLLKSGGEVPALRLLPELHRVGMLYPGVTNTAESSLPPDQPVVDTTSGEVLSDTGELWRSWTRRIGWIDSPRTKAAYGFLGGAGRLALKGLELDVSTEFATICLSSLTDDPIEQSESLLLTAVGRCDNTDAQYSEDGTRQLSFGRPPVLIEPIQARLAVHTRRSNLKVWVISDKGEAVTRLPAVYKDGVLSFEIGPQPSYNPSTMYYLIKI
jgi:hypothetical protein